MWCIPPDQNAAFVAAMEDVLEVYSRAYNPDVPVVCMDEQPIELHSDSRETIKLSEKNHTEKVDHEYIRNGTCCVFMPMPEAIWEMILPMWSKPKTPRVFPSNSKAAYLFLMP